MNILPDGQLVAVKTLGSISCHWLVSSNFSQCCSHDANKQTLLLFYFTPTPDRHKCLLDRLAPGTVQPPQLISFLASCLLVNTDEMSKRMCGYRALTMIMFWVIVISKLHIMNTDCIGDVEDEGKGLCISTQGAVIRFYYLQTSIALELEEERTQRRVFLCLENT